MPHRITVQDVVREAVGKKLDAQLSDLADQLADRLLAPADFIMIRWYFLQHWLPKLGHRRGDVYSTAAQPLLLQR